MKCLVPIVVCVFLFGCTELSRSKPGPLSPPSRCPFEAESRAGNVLTKAYFEELLEQMETMQDRMNSIMEGSSGFDEGSFSAVPQNDGRLFMIPTLLSGVRHLFHPPPWTTEERELGEAFGSFLARYLDRNELRVDASSDAVFERDLRNIKRWVDDLMNDEMAVASMISMFDDGPFSGVSEEISDVSGLEELGFVELSAALGKVGLYQNDDGKSSIIMCRIAPENTVAWAIRLIAGEGHEIWAPIGFSKNAVEFDEGFGFKLNMYATWLYGTERMTTYLDTTGDLRFFFLSW